MYICMHLSKFFFWPFRGGDPLYLALPANFCVWLSCLFATQLRSTITLEGFCQTSLPIFFVVLGPEDSSQGQINRLTTFCRKLEVWVFKILFCLKSNGDTWATLAHVRSRLASVFYDDALKRIVREREMISFCLIVSEKQKYLFIAWCRLKTLWRIGTVYEYSKKISWIRHISMSAVSRENQFISQCREAWRLRIRYTIAQCPYIRGSMRPNWCLSNETYRSLSLGRTYIVTQQSCAVCACRGASSAQPE